MPFFKNKSKRLRQRQRIKSRNQNNASDDPNNDNLTIQDDDAQKRPEHPRHGTMTSILKQLSYKLFMYAFVFIFLKGYATKNKNNMKNNPGDYRVSNPQLSSPIHVIKNLLPSDVADKWHDQLSTIWNEKYESNRRATREKNDVVDDDDNDDNMSTTNSSWNFVTNNNGNISENNDDQQQKKTTQSKVKTFHNIQKRNETAKQMYTNNQFSYAHWELDDTHSIMNDIGKLFLKGAIKKRLMSVITELINDGVSDEGKKLGRREFTPQSLQLSMMNFDTGNFLLQYSDHVDSSDNSSAWAVILSLSKRRRGDNKSDDESLKRAGGNSNKATNKSKAIENNNDHYDDDAGDITFRFSCHDNSNSSSSSSQYGDDDDDTKTSSSESPPHSRGPLTKCETIRPEFNEALIFPLPSKGHYFEVSPVSYRRRTAVAIEEEEDGNDSSNESENFILALLIRGDHLSSLSSSMSPGQPSHESKELSSVEEL